MLRAVEIGVAIHDLDFLSVGMVLDMFAEKMNDSAEEGKGKVKAATQADIDNF